MCTYITEEAYIGNILKETHAVLLSFLLGRTPLHVSLHRQAVPATEREERLYLKDKKGAVIAGVKMWGWSQIR